MPKLLVNNTPAQISLGGRPNTGVNLVLTSASQPTKEAKVEKEVKEQPIIIQPPSPPNNGATGVWDVGFIAFLVIAMILVQK